MTLLENWRQNFQSTKQLINDKVNELSNTAQQSSYQAVNTVTSGIDTLKDSLHKTMQSAENIQQSTSTAIQNSMNYSINDWLVQHPAIYKLVQLLGWAANHPIWSVILALLFIAFAWSIIRALIRLIEAASLSILKTPLRLIWLLISYIGQKLGKYTAFGWNKLTNSNAVVVTLQGAPIINVSDTTTNDTKPERLAEISVRLAEIQSEQNALLAEAAELLKLDKNHVEVYQHVNGNHNIV
ncbi:hypothetical protein NIES4071_75440 [Calothrix sp. NIES-4071]|nr:hypothetical protein NIES4071_75440 [Calothrix sp. NIES-4071]BAZ61819.1 hypothetical protein NIES4105_75390 [Calothrix sp. NIES-4105]